MFLLNKHSAHALIKGLMVSAVLGVASTAFAQGKPANSPITYQAPYAQQAPIIDGLATDNAWSQAKWRNIDQVTAAAPPSNSDDFSGRYKVVWTEEYLYILAEITDDILMDSHASPLDSYWKDDALEIFIDEDNNGGDHKFNYEAFAYHIALDNQAVDKGPFLSKADEQAGKMNLRVYPHHITSQWQRSAQAPHKIYWEVQLAAYPSTYQDTYAANQTPVKPVSLNAGKKIGFMMAYCDSDTPKQRDHFVGDINITPVNGDKNRGYIDSSVFGTLELMAK